MFRGADTRLGYCTNVHPGRSLAEIQSNLARYALSVRNAISAHEEPLDLGLWFPASAIAELEHQPERVDAFRDWLSESRLRVFTANAFPYGDFHMDVVKTRVYEPDWTTERRREYSAAVLRLLTRLSPSEPELSASTLPLGFGTWTDQQQRIAAEHCTRLADELESIEQTSGIAVHLDFEPEPGCAFDVSTDVVKFFHEHLDHVMDAARARRYFRVCHDVCHAAVMAEDQATMFRNYDDAGLAVGKVQLSSALRVLWDQDEGRRLEQFESLRAFAEDRYLHQTIVLGSDAPTMIIDLPHAIAEVEQGSRSLTGEWRIHFHVPVHAAHAGVLGTTREELREAIALLNDRTDVRHFEVETYAWNVLPDSLATNDLAAGIADELRWVRAEASR